MGGLCNGRQGRRCDLASGVPSPAPTVAGRVAARVHVRALAVRAPLPIDFSPLSDDEKVAAQAVSRANGAVDKAVIVPVPDDAPSIDYRHPLHGAPTALWEYRDAGGALHHYRVRFNFYDQDGAPTKDVVPVSFCVIANGDLAWRQKAPPGPWPLFNLRALLARPDSPVLVVEGEKTAEAAQLLFPDYVCVTSAGGANAARSTDWTSLRGRRVTVWRDADDQGRNYETQVVRAAHRSGAALVATVPVPDAFEDFVRGWDLADAPPAGWTPERLRRELLEQAGAQPVPGITPPNYVMRPDGLWWREPESDKPDLHLSGPFEVVAETRNADGHAWGVLLRWRDHDGCVHEWAMPRAMLAGDGADARRVLMDRGLYVAPGRRARELLNAYLTAVQVSVRARAVERIGWHGRAFVLPDETIGSTDSEHTLLQTGGPIEHAFRTAGSLSDWQKEVAARCAGNSRLAFSLSIAFAAPLLQIVGAESGGFHLRGPSSIGKSTALVVAGSVWGGGGLNGYPRQWRATDNGLEAIAAGHSDALLCLDELSQVEPKAAGATAYMLANGAGKARAARGGEGRPPAQWRLLFLSTGEISLADKLAEDGRGRRASAGQFVRVVDVPADAEAGYGLFEDLHGQPSADAFARELKVAASRNYGTAAREFIRRVTLDPDSVRDAVVGYRSEFLTHYCPTDASGQVKRVADRFALVAASGELAIAFGLLPWAPGAAESAAGACFCAWTNGRGGVEAAEVVGGIAQVRHFIELHGESRFTSLLMNEGGRPTINRAGFRKTDDVGNVEYFVLPQVWRTEVCSGFDAAAVARALKDKGMLRARKDGKLQVATRLPGSDAPVSCYVITAALFEGE